jgi:hypothetical protein
MLRLNTFLSPSPASAALAAGLVFSFWAMAQTEFVEIGKIYPPMIIRICKNLNAAKHQAEISANLAHGAISLDRFNNSIVQGCQIFSAASIKALAIVVSIQPFRTWAITHDPSSEGTCAYNKLPVPCSLKMQPIRYYQVEFLGSDGRWYQGWAEIPERLYGLAYGQSRP